MFGCVDDYAVTRVDGDVLDAARMFGRAEEQQVAGREPREIEFCLELRTQACHLVRCAGQRHTDLVEYVAHKTGAVETMPRCFTAETVLHADEEVGAREQRRVVVGRDKRGLCTCRDRNGETK